jgi:hypothetical protein
MITTEILRREIHRFDIYSLLALLQHLGFRREQILFRSHPTSSSQSSLLQDIEIRRGAVPRVIITVNLGLLGAQSPLPSYFMKRLEKGNLDTRLFLDFMGYFDHRVISNYLASIYPESDPALFPDWQQAKRDYLLLLNLRSRATLQWLLRLAVPELGVRVEKADMRHTPNCRQIVLGKAALGGEAVFGRHASVRVDGLRITFFSDEECTDRGEPWPREVQKRLSRLVFPALRAVGVDVEILVVLRSSKSWVRLQRESYLGFDMIRGGKAAYRRLPIYSGRLIDQDDGSAATDPAARAAV